jgi:Na+/serine symporter
MHGTECFLIEKKITKTLLTLQDMKKGPNLLFNYFFKLKKKIIFFLKTTRQANTGTNIDIIYIYIYIYILPVRNKLGFVVRFCYARLREAPWRIAIACSRSSSLLASVCHTKTHCPSTASAAPMAA